MKHVIVSIITIIMQLSVNSICYSNNRINPVANDDISIPLQESKMSHNNRFVKGIDIDEILLAQFPDLDSQPISYGVTNNFVYRIYKSKTSNLYFDINVGILSDSSNAFSAFSERISNMAMYPVGRTIDENIGDRSLIWTSQGKDHETHVSLVFTIDNAYVEITTLLELNRAIQFAKEIENILSESVISETEFRNAPRLLKTETQEIDAVSEIEDHINIQVPFESIENLIFGTDVEENKLGNATIKKEAHNIMIEYSPNNIIQSGEDLTFTLFVADNFNRITRILIHVKFN